MTESNTTGPTRTDERPPPTGQARNTTEPQEAAQVDGGTYLTKSMPDRCSEEDLVCRYSPLNWVCQGYDPIENYQYFDGDPGSSDQRFLIDLETDSMEGMYDVRPYLYGMGYWYDEMNNSVPAYRRFAAQGDLAIEAYYVLNGRASLRAERAKGHGYFLEDRDWSKYNTGDATTMPFCGPCGELPGDVGFDDMHPDIAVDMERGLLKTNIRPPLPDREVITVEIGGKKWEKFIHWLYCHGVHPSSVIMTGSPTLPAIKFERAMAGWGEGYMIEEGMYLYPNPDSIHPCSMRPAEAREYLAERAAAYS